MPQPLLQGRYIQRRFLQGVCLGIEKVAALVQLPPPVQGVTGGFRRWPEGFIVDKDILATEFEIHPLTPATDSPRPGVHPAGNSTPARSASVGRISLRSTRLPLTPPASTTPGPQARMEPAIRHR